MRYFLVFSQYQFNSGWLMKLILSILFFLMFSLSFGQVAEQLIPKDAVTVFSLNNIQLLQKVSLDDLVKYEFMAEVQQELFDGSTSGKTLKDAGMDFDQKLNVFYGKGDEYEVSGFTFGIKDKAKLFEVFDDFDKAESPYPGTELYVSFFNNLIIKGNSGLLIRVDPTMEKIDELTDSIWYARGNENPWMDDYYLDDSEGMDESSNETLYEEETEEDGTVTRYYSADDDNPNRKNYFELRDSVMTVYQTKYFYTVCDELFIKNYNLMQHDLRFTEQIAHVSEGIFYLDNSRSLQKAQNLWYIQTMFPSLYKDIKELYTGNVILGDLFLKESSVEFHIEARYGEALGTIYQKMNDSKFDKNTLKYIHKDNSAFFTYNVNLREAYEQAFKVIVPLLSDEKNLQVSYNLLLLELLNEYVNKDALFSTYKGSMFGTFNGIKKIKTRKIEFIYDEETFEYQEVEVEAEEDMPVFTVGFSTDRGDIPEKVLKHLSRLTSRFKNMGSYWIYEEAVLDAAPLYMIHADGLFIFTNDADLAMNHSEGYGKEAMGSKMRKKVKKSGFMYSSIDWGTTIDKFPRDFFSAEQNEMLDAMRGKTGTMELTSTKTTTEKTNFKLVYDFSGQTSETTGKYILDLINSVYVISR
jgi:hypothetical protein